MLFLALSGLLPTLQRRNIEGVSIPRIGSVLIINPLDVSVLKCEETGDILLLLVTCYPASFDIILSNQRLVKGLSLNLGRSYAATDRC